MNQVVGGDFLKSPTTKAVGFSLIAFTFFYLGQHWSHGYQHPVFYNNQQQPRKITINKLNSTVKGEKFERHCPQEDRKLNCLVPPPEGYKHRFHGREMVPEIAIGNHTRVILDVFASFGAFLLSRNVTALSIALKDVHENQIQFTLERGVPAMVAVFATRRLLYPSQAFELRHCSGCRINWTRDDGVYLLEINRMLRGGGYFAWAAQGHKHELTLEGQWKEMEDLTTRLCWELVKKEGNVAMWRKPSNNSCYLVRDAGARLHYVIQAMTPTTYVGLEACISRLTENGYGTNITTWPNRLDSIPDRLYSIRLDFQISRGELFKAENEYWKKMLISYLRSYHWERKPFRNVMDMRAGFGGFAAALIDLGMDNWIMNVVPVSAPNTLPVIYDRGLIGVMHDWCEPFDTYPRTYDPLNANRLFSTEQKRCNISTIMLEMDRILRPGGIAYVLDIGKAMGWQTTPRDSMDGPHANWKLLKCEKNLLYRKRKRRNMHA
ncbi:hypothetical protein MKX01_040044 [Papaver californicum]|nr:hypothetical protein MKX01_040044 [Papaver californicum]